MTRVIGPWILKYAQTKGDWNKQDHSKVEIREFYIGKMILELSLQCSPCEEILKINFWTDVAVSTIFIELLVILLKI